MQVLRPAAPRILGGRDVPSGGTWLAVNEHGVCAGLANRPSPGGRDPSRRSRGELPFLLAQHSKAERAVLAFEKAVVCTHYNPCWLLVCDRTALFYIVVGDDTEPVVTRLPPGLHVLGNDPLGHPSPKVEMVCRALTPICRWSGPVLLNELCRVLRSHDVPALSASRDLRYGAVRWPPEIHAACVHTAAYGTRSATMIVVPPEVDCAPKVFYADGPLCRSPLVDMSELWPVSSG